MSTVLVLALWLAVIAAYVAPSVIALARRAPNLGIVIAVDLLTGWTFFGWVVALCLALRAPQPRPYPAQAHGPAWPQQLPPGYPYGPQQPPWRPPQAPARPDWTGRP
jgi:hypothetical protein